MEYYVMRCQAADLDPRSQPFQYILLPGRRGWEGRPDEPAKLILYASKGTADQLIAKHQLSVKILRRGFDKEVACYVAEVQVTFPGGQTVEDIGAVFIREDAKGDALANGLMKAVTKAKRRTVLSACGLGMLDESEVDTIPNAIRVNSEGHALTIEPPIGAPAAIVHDATNEPKSEEVSECKAFIRQAIRAAEDELRNVLLIEGMADKFEPLPNEFAVAQYLVSQWIADGLIEKESVEKVNRKGEVVRDRAKVGATVGVEFSRQPGEFKADVLAYLKRKAAEFVKGLGIEMDDEPADVNGAELEPAIE
jgi:hypothetical protein